MNESIDVNRMKDSEVFAIIAGRGLSCPQRVYSFDRLNEQMDSWRSPIGVIGFRNEKELEDGLSNLIDSARAKSGYDLYVACLDEDRLVLVVRYFS